MRPRDRLPNDRVTSAITVSDSPPKLPWRNRLRHRPEPAPRLSCLRLQHVPILIDRPVTVPGEHPGQSLPDQLLVDEDIPHPNEGHGPAVSVHVDGLHLDELPEDKGRGRPLRLGAEVLALLRAVNTVKGDMLFLAIVEDGDAVAIRDTDDLAKPRLGKRRDRDYQDPKNHDGRKYDFFLILSGL
jgi:hypothetical protein